MVSNRALLGIAGFVWLAAGINILRIGIKSAVTVFSTAGFWRILLVIILAAAIFTGFHLMFTRIVGKHTTRILNYKEKQPFWKFFDLKSYILMIFMMGLGIGLRHSGWLPDFFFAFFYTGLGTALSISGIRFLLRCLHFQQLTEHS